MGRPQVGPDVVTWRGPIPLGSWLHSTTASTPSGFSTRAISRSSCHPRGDLAEHIPEVRLDGNMEVENGEPRI